MRLIKTEVSSVKALARAHGSKRETADAAMSGVSRAAHTSTADAGLLGPIESRRDRRDRRNNACATHIVDISAALLSLSYILQWHALGGKFKI